MIIDYRKMMSVLGYIVKAEFSALFEPRKLTFSCAIEMNIVGKKSIF